MMSSNMVQGEGEGDGEEELDAALGHLVVPEQLLHEEHPPSQEEHHLHSHILPLRSPLPRSFTWEMSMIVVSPKNVPISPLFRYSLSPFHQAPVLF